jgi:hypothetical protein
MIGNRNIIFFVNQNFKFTVVLLMNLICYTSLLSQNLDGTYTCGQQKIIIDNSQIEYDLIAWGYCIHTPINGNGTIQIKNNRLFIEPNGVKSPKISTIEKIEPSDSKTMIIRNEAIEPFPYFINFFGKKKHTYIIQSDTNGMGKILRNKVSNYDSVSINYIGAKPVGTRLTNLSNYDFKVNLAFYEEGDFHYDFITNEGKGIKLKARSDKIYLKYNKRMKRHSKKQRDTWHRFDKEK